MTIDTERIGDQLRGKIASKFQLTGTLAALDFTVLSIQLTLLHQENVPYLLPQSIGVLFSALGLFFFGMYRLDALTMPKLFWNPSKGNRPPGPEGDPRLLTEKNLRALKTRMVFIWTRYVLLAVGLTIAGLALLIVPLDPVERSEGLDATWQWTLGLASISGSYCTWLWSDERKREKTDPDFGRLLTFID